MTPIITKIRTRVGDSGDEDRALGGGGTGGYHKTSDPNDTATYLATATEGRAIWVLDLKTGVLLARHKFDTAGNCANPATVVNNTEDRKMCFSLASTPAVYDADVDGFADVIYVPDLGGNVWKWVVKEPAHARRPPPRRASRRRTGRSGSSSRPTATTPAPTASTRASTSRPRPRKNGKIWLAFGWVSGTTSALRGSTSTTADNNRFYVVEEIDIFDQLATIPPVVTDANLTNLTGTNTCASLGSFRGYYFVGAEREKWVTNVELFVGYVIANSYISPDAVAAVDPCEIAGQAFLWAFKVECGEGLFRDASGNPTAPSTSAPVSRPTRA